MAAIPSRIEEERLLANDQNVGGANPWREGASDAGALPEVNSLRTLPVTPVQNTATMTGIFKRHPEQSGGQGIRTLNRFPGT